MSKKLACLAPLAAIIAFVMVPAAAQSATPCYTKNSQLCSSIKAKGVGTPVEVVAYGTLTLKTVVGGTGEVTCFNAGAGTVWNEAARGGGQTEIFATAKCASSTCPLYAEVKAEKLPWPSELEEAVPPTIRSKTTGVKINIICWASKAASETPGEKPLGNAVFIGSNEPELVNKGTIAPQASLVEFEPSGTSGKLEAEGSSGTVFGQTEGHLQNFTTKMEVLSARKGP
jgi:hypothetical protein